MFPNGDSCFLPSMWQHPDGILVVGWGFGACPQEHNRSLEPVSCPINYQERKHFVVGSQLTLFKYINRENSFTPLRQGLKLTSKYGVIFRKIYINWIWSLIVLINNAPTNEGMSLPQALLFLTLPCIAAATVRECNEK